MALANQFLLTACPLALLVGTCLPASTQVAAPRGQRDEAAQHAQRGLEFARAGQLDRAEAELREATGLAPSDPDVLAALGTVLAQEQKLEESTAVFKRALQLNPDNLTVRRYLAANLWQLHRYGEARDSLQIILKRKPDDEAAQLLLGMVSENMGDYAAAARLLAVIPDEVRKQPESVAALVRSYYHLGQTEKARETLMQLTSHPAGAPALFLGAQIADEMQDYSTAEKLLTSIRLEFPGQARVKFTLAMVNFHVGEFDQSSTSRRSDVFRDRLRDEDGCDLQPVGLVPPETGAAKRGSSSAAGIHNAGFAEETKYSRPDEDPLASTYFPRFCKRQLEPRTISELCRCFRIARNGRDGDGSVHGCDSLLHSGDAAGDFSARWDSRTRSGPICRRNGRRCGREL